MKSVKYTVDGVSNNCRDRICIQISEEIYKCIKDQIYNSILNNDVYSQITYQFIHPIFLEIQFYKMKNWCDD